MKKPELVVGLDWETYYCSAKKAKELGIEPYSLKGMSTTGYIKDERFAVQGVGIRTNRSGGTRWYTNDKVLPALAEIDWRNAALLAHHTHFDGLILSHHFGFIPSFYYCTLSMARPIVGAKVGGSLNAVAEYYGYGEKHATYLDAVDGVREPEAEALKILGDGCKRDVVLMWQIFLRMLEDGFPESELDLIHHTVRAYVEPILTINKALCKREHKREVKKKQDMLDKIGIGLKPLRSRTQFPQLLRDAGLTEEEMPYKVSPTTNKLTYAFAKNDLQFQELQFHRLEAVRDLYEAKGIVSSSLGETRPLRILQHGTPSLPVYLNYCGAHTFRWSGGDKCNLQNLQRDSELRNAIKPPTGHKLVIVDSAQIEARVNAWLANELDLLEAFAAGRDIYSEFASEEVFHLPLDEITKEMRFVGKVAILGLGFQMGWLKFRNTLNSGQMGIPFFFDDDLLYERTVTAYRTKYASIRNQWYVIQDLLNFMGTSRKGSKQTYGPVSFVAKQGINMPNGLMMQYPDMRYKETEDADGNKMIHEGEWIYGPKGNKIYGGLATENIVQSLARIIVGGQLAPLAEKYRLVLMAHDEGVFCVPRNQAKQCLGDAIDAFRTPPDWCSDLPLDAEGGIASYYMKM